MIRHTNPMGRFIILNGLRLTIHGLRPTHWLVSHLKKISRNSSTYFA